MAESKRFADKIYPPRKASENDKANVEICIDCPYEYVRQNNVFPAVEKTAEENENFTEYE